MTSGFSLRPSKTFTGIFIILSLTIAISVLATRARAERSASSDVGADSLNQAGPQPMSPGMTFNVTKVADTNDGVCDADCSFREAIVAANANIGLDTIAFHIGSGLKTILPTSALPSLTDPVVIDGTTQPGFSGAPLIEVDGSNAGDVTGITVNGGNSTIRGLIVNGFRSTGIQVFTKGNNLIAGNYVGTNAAGTAARNSTQNNGVGILIASQNNIVGGTTVADRNIVSGNKNANGSSGIWIQSASATGNKIIGNFIGTDVTGQIPIAHGNGGILCITGASGNFIGGLTLERNIIAGGNNVAISIGDSHSNKVMRNLIGVSATGTELGNGLGIQISGSSHDNVIGGPNTGDGNVIAYSKNSAIWVNSSTAIRNSFLGNNLFNNWFGIDLGSGGISLNDANDPDSGPNNLQNFPLITSANPNGASATIAGTLNSVSNTQYRIELFSSPTCLTVGNGEGKSFLGSTTATLVGNDGTFNVTVPFDVLNKYITATATDPTGNTSEFSPCVLAGNPNTGALHFADSVTSVGEGLAATITVKRDGGSVGAASVQYSVIPVTATPIDDYDPVSGTLTWADGDSAPKTFAVQTKLDSVAEGLESVKLILANSVGAPLTNPNVETLEIFNQAPILSITDVSKAEGNSGTTNFIFDVNLVPVSQSTVTVNYTTTQNTALSGNDFQPTSGILTFTPGQANQQIIVQVNGDPDEEPNEHFFVDLSNPTNAALPMFRGTGTILNDDNTVGTKVQFSQPGYTVAESLSEANLTVTRIGDTSGITSVGYKTVDGTATQKGDFEYAAGRITFQPGETSKAIFVLLNEDTYVEGPETFSVSLESPVGATLGSASTASVSITDDNPESQTNPLDDAQTFVTMQYRDFLNREPDPEGLAFWTNQITSCGSNQQCLETKRINVSAAFFLSIEFQQTGYLVYRTHKAAFGSAGGGPTPVRLTDFLTDTQAISRGVIVNSQGWESILENSKVQFMKEFVQRPEFTAQFPTSMTPSQFVDLLLTHAGLVLPVAERNVVVSKFNNAADTASINARAEAVRVVAENPTFTQQEFNKAFVLMQYFGYLRRNPNDSPEPGLNFDGYNFWLNKLNAFGGNYVNAELVKAFIQSSEYRQRFGM